MKIALVGNTLFHQGAEYVLAILARGFAAKGHKVDVILSALQNEILKEHADWKPFEMTDGVRVIVTSARRGRHSVLPFRRLIKKNQYDVVMSHASPFSIPLILSTIGLKKKPLLIHVQHSGGTGVDDDGNLLQPRFTLKSFLRNLIMSGFDAQIGVSSGTSEGIHRMSGYPKGKIFTAYNPVVDDLFLKKLQDSPTHPWLKNPELPVFVAAGVFMANKNYAMLIRAFARAIRHKPARLVIFGRGEEMTNYQAEVRRLGVDDFVSFPGHTNNLPAEIKNATCLVISSILESFSVVCVEALAAGVPVVSTDCPYGPPEILGRGKYGTLVENRNEDALAKALEDVLDGKCIKPPAESWLPYTLDAVIDRYENAINIIKERAL